MYLMSVLWGSLAVSWNWLLKWCYFAMLLITKYVNCDHVCGPVRRGHCSPMRLSHVCVLLFLQSSSLQVNIAYSRRNWFSRSPLIWCFVMIYSVLSRRLLRPFFAVSSSLQQQLQLSRRLINTGRHLRANEEKPSANDSNGFRVISSTSKTTDEKQRPTKEGEKTWVFCGKLTCILLQEMINLMCLFCVFQNWGDICTWRWRANYRQRSSWWLSTGRGRR